MTDTPNTPAGWYPSPNRPGSNQYFDGTAWTEQFAPMAAPAAQPQTVIVQQKKGSAGKVLLILFGLCVLMLGGCIAFIASASNEVADSIEEASDARDSDEALVEDNATCEVTETTDFTTTGTVTFTNPLDEEKGYIGIEVAFLDAEGTSVGSGTATFENLSPGQKAIGEALGFDIPDGVTVASCEVTDGTIL